MIEMLTLPIKAVWFLMIKDGIKKEEYREPNSYYNSRFSRYENQKITVIFRNGYNRNSPSLKCDVIPRKKFGNPAWGAEPYHLYWTLEIMSVSVV